MPDTKPQIKLNYPLPAYNYRVTILADGDAETIGFSEVNGLSMSYDPVIYKDGMSFALGQDIIPGMAKPINLSLKKGLTRSGDYLHRWFAAAYRDPFSGGAKRDVIIDLCDEAGQPVVRWTVAGAMPTKLDASALVASGNEVAIAAMDLVAARLEVEFNP